MTRDGTWSVVSEPGLSFRVLCASVRHGTVRRTTLGQVREAGGSLMPSHGSGAPSHHCDLVGLTAAAFDAILSPEERNPILAHGALARLELMIVIEVDFNHLDGAGRLLLADLVVHERTPFAEIAVSGERVLFVDGGEFVEGSLAQDTERGWVGVADWATQDRLRSYPADRPALTPLAG